MDCHFLLQCMKVKTESEVAQSCLTPSDPMDCSLPGSSIHGIFQARVLEWDAIAFSVSSPSYIDIFLNKARWRERKELTRQIDTEIKSAEPSDPLRLPRAFLSFTH